MLNKKALSATAGAPKVFVEDVFSCFLYTGNGSTQTITNNIDLSTEGGLVWTKKRATGADNNYLFDTARGTNKVLYSDLTNGSDTWANSLTAYNANGFSLGSGGPNTNADTYVSWTFRKAKKFFDVVTWTGNGTAGRTISHNLGSVPGAIFVKQTNASGENWDVYHRSLANNKQLYLNATNAELTTSSWNSTTPTSTVFTVGDGASINGNGKTYVAYLFAHDAGGFGDAGSDSIIKCGSYSGTGTTNFISLGWEPQWVLVKRSDSTGDWHLLDNMRGWVTDSSVNAVLFANTSGDEGQSASGGWPAATGFYAGSGAYTSSTNTNGGTYIYIAIRRGPMKTPTTGTSVFSPVAYSGTSANDRIITASITPDLVTWANRDSTGDRYEYDRLRGSGTWLKPNTTGAEGADGTTYGVQFNKVQTGYQQGTADGGFLNSSSNYVNWLFRRAPGFFDVVCYTGTGSATTVSHNLGVAPELMIVKRRGTSNAWAVYANNDNTDYLVLNTTAATVDDNTYWNDTSPTSSVFSVGTNNATNASGSTYVAYLFASVNGVSKVGTYTGNGSNQTINCGFTAGARFILIKRTDSTGDWYVYDSARGIVSGNDPQLKLNTTDAEATGYDAIDPDNSGFIVNNDATNFPINVNNATYIYLAIA